MAQEQVHLPVRSRWILCQAEGMLSAQLHTDVDFARRRIAEYARDHHRAADEVAAAIVARELHIVERAVDERSGYFLADIDARRRWGRPGECLMLYIAGDEVAPTDLADPRLIGAAAGDGRWRLLHHERPAGVAYYVRMYPDD